MEALYKGLSGYVYTLADVGFRPLEGKRGVWAAGAEAPVTACRFIPHVYDALLEAQRAGRLRVRAYSALTPAQRQENDTAMIAELFALNWAAFSPKRAAFFKNHFPRAWDYVTRNPHKKADFLAPRVQK